MGLKMLLIQGFFCQRDVGLSLFAGDAVVRTSVVSVMFAGTIWHRNHNPEAELVGEMLDGIGQAILSEVKVTDEKITFTKQYIDRYGSPHGDQIGYELHKEKGNEWVGEYAIWAGISDDLTGPVRCFTSPYDAAVFRKDLERYNVALKTREREARRKKPPDGKQEEIPF